MTTLLLQYYHVVPCKEQNEIVFPTAFFRAITKSMKLRCIDLFSGIGGAALALHRIGNTKVVAYCENDINAVQVLKNLIFTKNSLMHLFIQMCVH